jgi:hypothetical protein
MALSVLHCQGVIGFGVDTATNARGIVQKFINRTGATSALGTVVSCSTATDREVIKQANEFDSIGVIAESGVAEGSEMWVWLNGSTCQVLWKNTETATRGYVAIAADTDGRALNIAVPSSSPAAAEHFKEIGHVMQTKGATTDLLVLCNLHFN